MNAQTKKRLLVVGGVVAVGAVAYWLWQKSQEPSAAPLPAPGPTPQPLPSAKQPSAQLQDAITAYRSTQLALQNNPFVSPEFQAQAQARLASARQSILTEAAKEGVTVNI